MFDTCHNEMQASKLVCCTSTINWAINFQFLAKYNNSQEVLVTSEKVFSAKLSMSHQQSQAAKNHYTNLDGIGLFLSY